MHARRLQPQWVAWIVLGWMLLPASARAANDCTANDRAALACERRYLREAEQEMARYLRAAREEQRRVDAGTSAAMPPAVDLDTDQDRWSQMRATQCEQDTASAWVGQAHGRTDTSAELEALRCKRQLTLQRSHWFWRNWLVGVGAGQPRLPEPVLPP